MQPRLVFFLQYLIQQQGIFMKKIKPLVDFIKFAVAIKVAFYLNVIAKLTNNPVFPTPDVSLADAAAAVANIEAAALAAQDGGATAKSHLRDVIEAADLLFIRQAHYVDSIANGDETKILSSGFHESKQPTPFNKPALSAMDTAHSGIIKLIAKAILGARAYIWQMATTANPAEGDWVTISTTTSATYTHEGLVPGSYCEFRVAAVTPEGISDYCDPVRKLIH